MAIAVIAIKCYLNWKKQHKKELRLAEKGVQQLVLSSQPIDFIPLLLQDTLEPEDEEDDEFDSTLINCYMSGTSTEDVSYGQTSQLNRKVRRIFTIFFYFILYFYCSLHRFLLCNLFLSARTVTGASRLLDSQKILK